MIVSAPALRLLKQEALIERHALEGKKLMALKKGDSQ
jgi:hypothetical protein